MFRSVRSVLRRDAGTTTIEFIIAGLLLLVPLAYLVITLGTVQGQAMGVETASRQLARALSDARSGDPDAISTAVVETVTSQYGIDPERVQVRVTCDGAGACPRAGTLLTVTVATSVPLPLIPPILGLDRAARIPVSSSSTQEVSVYVPST